MDDEVSYQAISPDEVALVEWAGWACSPDEVSLVEWAGWAGLKLYNRTLTHITLTGTLPL